MASLFADLDLDNAQEFSSSIPDGTYMATIQSAEVQKGSKNDPDKVMLILGYELDVNGEPRTQKEWLTIPQGHPDSWDDSFEYETSSGRMTTEKKANELSRRALTTRFLGIGIPRGAINSLDPKDLIDLPVAVTLKTRKDAQYPEIAKVSKAGNAGVSRPTRPAGSSTSAPSKPAGAGENPFA